MFRPFFITLVLITGFGINAVAVAQDQSPPTTAQVTESGQRSTAADHRVIKPGDRNCLRSTGSLIKPKKGECLPVTGRSYSGDELRRTGQPDNARALQMLDPSISSGH